MAIRYFIRLNGGISLKPLLFLIISCFILSGCAGLADYSISLDNGYRIDRLSSQKIQIYGDETVNNEIKNEYIEIYGEAAINDEIKNGYSYLYVPTKVTDVWWDNDYIIAKQLRLILDEQGYKEPPKKPTEDDYSYWIIEIEKYEVKGPLTLKQLEYDLNQLEINVEFTPIEKLKRDP